MSVSFPTIVYKSPGFLDAGNRQTYKYQGCVDGVDLDIALASGWHLTLPAALEAAKPADPVVVGQLENQLTEAKAELAAADEKLAEAHAELAAADEKLAAAASKKKS